MGKKKASAQTDINAILSQLQKAYGVDSSDDSDDFLESETTYEDTELSELLAKIISENSSEDENSSDVASDSTEEGTDDVVSDESDDVEAYDAETHVEDANDDIEVSVDETSENSDDLIENQEEDFPFDLDEPDQNEENEIDTDLSVQKEENTDVPSASDTDDDQEDEVDDSLTFGDLDEDQEDEVDDSLTFGDLDEDQEDEIDDSLTFGDLDDDQEDEIDDSLTFGDLDDDQEDEIDDSLTFGNLDDDQEDEVDDDLVNEVDKEDVIFEEINLDDRHTELRDGEMVETNVDEAEKAQDNTSTELDFPFDLDEDEEPDQENKDSYEAALSVEELVQAEMDPYHVMLEQFYDDVDDTIEIVPETVSEVTCEEPVIPAPEFVEETQPVDEDVILSKEEYTDDPLQWHIDRTQKRVLQKIPEEALDEPKKKAEIHDDDISILLQLGYKDELNSQVGHDRTDFVVQSITNAYRPDKNKIPFGFCGKEFSNSEQIQKIKQKYDYDKRTIIVKMALFSCVSLVLLLLGMLFKNSTDIASVIMFSVMEIIIIALGCVVIHKDLLSGIRGIFKFSPTVFTIPIFSLAVLFAYDIFVIVLCASRPGHINVTATSLFGFTTSLFFIFALASQLMNCIREQRTFDLISTSSELYAAEELISRDGDKSEANNLRFHEVRKQIKGNAVSVKKTAYISQYFKRCSESSYSIGNITLALGAVPLFAMILACIVIAFEREAADVAATIVFAFYMCISASFVLIMPATMFAASKNLSQRKCGIVGTGAIREYENVNSIIFPDSSAFEVEEHVEVLPVGEVDMNASIKTANRLFKALGGTLSEVIGKNAFNRDESMSMADINIAFIDNNGVELYMDNATHIMLGNEKFILEHRKRLGFEACDMIPASYVAGREVMYLAIDDLVSLVYIFSVNSKAEFEDKVRLLSEYNIKTYVSTYEAHIKPTREKDCKIGVYRPYDHESPEKPTPRYGGIVASGDQKNIAYPLLMIREIAGCVKTSSKFSLWFILAGIVISLAITLIGYLAPGAGGILRHRDMFTVAIQLLSVIPHTVNAIRLWKKNK